VTGYTASPGWVAGGFNTTYSGTGDDFVVKLSGAGDHLWSTYIGNSAPTSGWDENALAVDDDGYVYVGGLTFSAAWMPEAFPSTYRGAGDAYVARITPDGARLMWAVCLGGAEYDTVIDLALDQLGNVYVAGVTESAGWTAGGYDTTFDGAGSNYLVKIIDKVGTLSAALTPPEAAAAGAQWRRAGTAAWLESGASESNLPVGEYAVEFRDIPNYDTPPTVTLTVLKDQVVTANGPYAPHLGDLSIMIEPPAATGGGALWRRVGLGTQWRASGEIEAGIRVGSHIVIFSDIPLYDRPADLYVTVAKDTLTTADALYRRHAGALTVLLGPAEAVAAGAAWRREGTEVWHTSGAAETGIPTGEYRVEFRPVPHWTQPLSRLVTIAKDETTALGTLDYVRQRGMLTVRLYPPEAVAAGAMWRRVGTAAWMPSGALDAGLPTGQYMVEFTPLAGWDAPETREVIIRNNQTNAQNAWYAASHLNAVDARLWNMYE
jgi:hypothetical protein